MSRPAVSRAIDQVANQLEFVLGEPECENLLTVEARLCLIQNSERLFAVLE
jgi:hypothetical protein